MKWIKCKWQSVAILSLAVAAIAVPAWASSGGSGDVQQASEPSGSDAGQVDPAPAPSGSDDTVPLDAAARRQLDQAINCMADRGFGAPPQDAGDPAEGGAVFIPRSETDTDAFQRAASDCQLPPPPTDVQIRQLACRDAQARDDRSDQSSRER
jgi:hypothetical protein